ncbi:hypothetical protein EW145_g2147 [Phellinidium pouzarii]|uniref:3-oxo-5-alpha-steroid 4-dehydrogenase C-terminal domain-containing protein n=1 Tax=Phellinidium pouzarii TaxID=167371 RepID=A0A4S4LBW2_9AGAM|nr:hypothetical protein EW145_g2147 [Phellinidium pouzarii]
MDAEHLYKEVCKWYALTPPVISVVTFFFDAPFGRFALGNDSKLQFDGIKSWIVMELVSPLAFLFGLLREDSTLSLSLYDPRTILALLYLTHYTNRALISPLRSPGRSKAHISVPLSGILFNIVNGTLIGTYLASPACTAFLSGSSRALGSTSFLTGLALWVTGFIGNVLHDEVLLDLRRDAQAKAAKESGARGEKKEAARPHYGIPHGYLYRFVSYPNYLCEWVEWTGFALAAAPFPSLRLGLTGFTSTAPPWLFLFSEVFLMAPRAYRGHQWYHKKFPDTYPEERRAVIPFIW